MHSYVQTPACVHGAVEQLQAVDLPDQVRYVMGRRIAWVPISMGLGDEQLRTPHRCHACISRGRYRLRPLRERRGGLGE